MPVFSASKSSPMAGHSPWQPGATVCLQDWGITKTVALPCWAGQLPPWCPTSVDGCPLGDATFIHPMGSWLKSCFSWAHLHLFLQGAYENQPSQEFSKWRLEGKILPCPQFSRANKYQICGWGSLCTPQLQDHFPSFGCDAERFQALCSRIVISWPLILHLKSRTRTPSHCYGDAAQFLR